MDKKYWQLKIDISNTMPIGSVWYKAGNSWHREDGQHLITYDYWFWDFLDQESTGISDKLVQVKQTKSWVEV